MPDRLPRPAPVACGRKPPGQSSIAWQEEAARLAPLEAAVLKLFEDHRGRWLSLVNLSLLLGIRGVRTNDASISARYRELVRKGYPLEKKQLTRGLWLYRMKPEDE